MEDAEIVEDAAEGPAPAPTAEEPAPAATLEIVHERPHSKNKEKSTENFGRPASTYSDFYMRTLFQPGLVDTQYNIDFLRKLVNTATFSFFALLHTCRAITSTSFKTFEHTLLKSNKFTIRNLCHIIIASHTKTGTFVNLVNLL